ncbi:CobW family GTP-binding protein [Alkalihalobacterium bogoriense]|uniref:CobW family GTP-binding protein n=1 Tax=Alkalihalobacterium bogoriense TaxID=246272 RepID=UPI00047AD8B2|nr:GTP-binding protein [Alkalihalobacterium bogoriense]
MSSKRIPVYLLTGFLGSGKTTVLLRMLEEMKQNGKKPAVILNELGEVNVEKSLFGQQSVMELLNGCICCTIQDDLKNELSAFLETQPDIDMIIIEGTGIANPKEVVEALTHPVLFEKVELYSIISLVDASKYLEYQSLFSSSKEIRTILKQQVSSCSLLVLNKLDLINEKLKTKVRKKLSETVEENKIIETSHGEVPLEELLKKRMESVTVSARHDHHHHHHHHDTPLFQALKIEDIPVVNKTLFEKWLKSLPNEVIRAKGVIDIEKQGRFSFQYSSGQFQLHGNEVHDEETCIIIIGPSLHVTNIQQSFQHQFSKLQY